MSLRKETSKTWELVLYWKILYFNFFTTDFNGLRMDWLKEKKREKLVKINPEKYFNNYKEFFILQMDII